VSAGRVLLEVLRHPATRAVLLVLLKELARIVGRRIEERIR